MKPELATFQAGMSQVFAAVEDLLQGLTGEQAAARPSPGAWSIVECIDHLTLTAKAYLPDLEHHLAQGRPQSTAAYQPGWLWRKFVQSMEPPVKRKYPTSPGFVPPAARSLDEVRRDFFAVHQAILDMLPQLESLDLSRIKIQSPFAKWIRYPLGLIFYILPAHCRRHIWQAQQARPI